ncbi:MAG: sensor domain-containing diguanylate cyclase [Cyanobacteria bacterium P01_G01_bin.54]
MLPIRYLIANLVCQLCRVPKVDQLQHELISCQNELQRIHKQQHALYRVIQKIRASLELNIIFQTTTKETCKLLQVERVAVYRFNANWGGKFVDDFEFVEPSWDSLEDWGKNPIWNDTYLQKHQGGRYQSNDNYITSDIYKANLTSCHLDILEQFHIRAYATVPIFIGETLWGILGAYQHSGSHHWTEQDIEFLSQVATQLGFAVKQAQLLSHARKKAKDLQIYNRQQQVLYDLIAEIRETLDIDILFRTTVKEVRKTLYADRVGIFQFEPGTNYHYGQFVAENVLPAFDSAITAKVRDRCFGDQYSFLYQQGRLQIVSDIDDANLSSCHIAILDQFQIKAQIIVPLNKDNQLWGLLCIHQCRSTRNWQPSEIQFVRQVAAQFTVALEHAHLSKQLEEQKVELSQTVKALQTANTQLELLNKIDPLTKIFNRGQFDEILKQEIEYSQKNQDSLSLILFDVDHFKCFNDEFGHPAGDQCLKRIAQAAQDSIQKDNHFLARYGGEEFGVILPNTSPELAIQVAQQIRIEIQRQAIPHASSCRSKLPTVTASLGVTSLIPQSPVSIQTLLEKADQALYQAKEQGRNQVVFLPFEQGRRSRPSSDSERRKTKVYPLWWLLSRLKKMF